MGAGNQDRDFGVGFFIPIVTPSSVASKYCRLEFEAFLEREAQLGRSNLIFPLLYVRVPALEKEELWRQDDLLRIIGTRQYLDWQKFRHRGPSDPEVSEKVEQYCLNIAEALRRQQTPSRKPSVSNPPIVVESPSPTPIRETKAPPPETPEDQRKQIDRVAPAPPLVNETPIRSAVQIPDEVLPIPPASAVAADAASQEFVMPSPKAGRDERNNLYRDQTEAAAAAADKAPASHQPKSSVTRPYLRALILAIAACLSVLLVYVLLSASISRMPAQTAATISSASTATLPSIPAIPGCDVFQTADTIGKKSKNVVLFYRKGTDPRWAREVFTVNGWKLINEITTSPDTVDYTAFLLWAKSQSAAILVFCGASSAGFARQGRDLSLIP